MTDVDVLIVGAGLSGIGAACRLRAEHPGRTLTILESRPALGGTWDLFRYPGIRSDSDMYTLGYGFRPWEEAKAIADGPAILRYIRETADEHGLNESIRFNHRVVRAEWSTPDARWTVDVKRTDGGEPVRLTCGFLYMCTGYYRYDEGYTPQFAGADEFSGEMVHPQHWPADLDYSGKRVVVIGSGATAITLVPTMAARAAHVTMLQRSPSYVISIPARDPIANLVRRVLPTRAAYATVRWKNALTTLSVFYACRRAPTLMKRALRAGVKRRLPAGYDIDAHFRPRYDPWDQRVCMAPDGDFFNAVCNGSASIVTDHVETFTKTGLRLRSGKTLDADIVITATGLNFLVLGGVSLVVDGREIHLPTTVGYKGMMLSGVPNLALALGYTNASWTLKCDLVAEYVCRLLAHMDHSGDNICTPRAPDPEMPTEPLLDLTSGYVLRSVDELPRQGSRTPWRLNQNYPRDVLLLRHGPLHDEGMQFTRNNS